MSVPGVFRLVHPGRPWYLVPFASRHNRTRLCFASMEILVLFALILLNGVFAMSEIAPVMARRTRLQKFVDEGDAGAAAPGKLGEDPTRFLSANA